MAILTGYSSVQSNLFVRIQIDEYRTTANGAYTQEVLRFGDSITAKTINSEVYLGLGRLVSISNSSSELRASGGEVAITISGIPDTNLQEILYSKIKGASVLIYRLFSDAATGNTLNIANNPVLRYRGYINNFSLTEEYDTDARTATNTVVLTCTSTVDVLRNKIAGRKTNPESHKKFYPGDVSMDRVPALENETFDFGVPK